MVCLASNVLDKAGKPTRKAKSGSPESQTPNPKPYSLNLNPYTLIAMCLWDILYFPFLGLRGSYSGIFQRGLRAIVPALSPSPEKAEDNPKP